jgi:hypothetical protein
VRVLRYFALGLLVVALIVTSVGWFRSAHAVDGSKFDSCTFDGTTLVLTWTYGVDSFVSPSVDVRSGRIVVGLREDQSSGAHIAVGLTGEARFAVRGASRPVEYDDGTALYCPPPAPR